MRFMTGGVCRSEVEDEDLGLAGVALGCRLAVAAFVGKAVRWKVQGRRSLGAQLSAVERRPLVGCRLG